MTTSPPPPPFSRVCHDPRPLIAPPPPPLQVSREVDHRSQELTHQVHREILSRCLDSVKTLSPILICSMKIFIQILHQHCKESDEAAENRNYLAGECWSRVCTYSTPCMVVSRDTASSGSHE